MGLSILAALSILSTSVALSAPSLRKSQTALPPSQLQPQPQKKVSATTMGTPSLNWGFLEQAEDIEREAWWVLTDQRWEGISSPFRILRAGLNKQNPGTKTKLRFKFCQKLKVHGPENETWRVESECQKTPQEVGRLKKLAPNRWQVEWRPGVLPDHFGLGTSILFMKQSCEIEVGANGRLQKMSCPGYARNRTAEEIIELKVFEFSLQNKSMLKLKGEVKKSLQVVSTIETQVPLAGDIVVKEKQIPQKAVEETADFSDSKALKPKAPAVKTEEGRETHEGLNGEKENERKEENQNAGQSQNSGQESRSHEGQNQNDQSPYIGQQGPSREVPRQNDPDAVQNSGYQNVDSEGRPTEPPPIEEGQGPHDNQPSPIESSPTGR